MGFTATYRRDTDAAEVQRRFVACWPPGSDAFESYHQRIVRGPAYTPTQALRAEG